MTLRAYRLLLRCYPRAFRDEFGDEMCATFERVWRDQPSALARARLWALTIAESVAGGAMERLADRRTPHATRYLPPPTASAMDTLFQDVRYSVRSLRRRPGLVAAIVVTLALGVGANTAIFSIVDAVLLRPVPVADPERVVAVYHRLNDRSPHAAFTYPLFRSLEGLRSFSQLAGYRVMSVGVRLGNRVEQLEIAGVSGNYFATLGLRAQAGRLLLPADDEVVGGGPVVVLSDEAWSRFYGREPSAVGTTLHAGGVAYTVVGVAPAGFRGTLLAAAPQLFFPITMSTSLGEGGLFAPRPLDSVFETTAFGWVELVGRLAEGSTEVAAASELNIRTLGYWRSLGSRQAAGRDTMAAPVSVVPLTTSAALSDRESLVRFITMLTIVVVLTLLIACVNVANLLIIRGTERERELAVRAALGAARGRLTRQALAETLLLALAGGVAAIGVSLIAIRILTTFVLPGGVSLEHLDLGINARALTFTLAVSVGAALLFGLLPAIRAGRAGASATLRGHGGNSSRGPSGLLIMAQAAMSVLLLVGAGLFVRSLQAGLATDLGLDTRNLAAVTVDLSLHGYDQARRTQFNRDVLERAEQLPGVSAAAISTHVPLARLLKLPMSPVEGSTPGAAARVSVGLVYASREYFDLVDTPVLAGRGFTEADDNSAERVAIVNESAARQLAPGVDILGREVRILGSIRYTVVGIVPDTKFESVRDSAVPVLFAPIAQPSSGTGTNIIVRSGTPRATLAGLRSLLTTIDPNLPVRNVRLVEEQVDTVLMPQRFGSTLLGVLALVALGIAAVGIYGVVAYGVSRRRRELGIRIALGAGQQHIVRVVALRNALAVGAGILVGLAGAVLGSRGVEQFLFGVTRLDLVAFGGAAVVLGLAAAIACWSPVRRAVRVDPMLVIRSE